MDMLEEQHERGFVCHDSSMYVSAVIVLQHGALGRRYIEEGEQRRSLLFATHGLPPGIFLHLQERSYSLVLRIDHPPIPDPYWKVSAFDTFRGFVSQASFGAFSTLNRCLVDAYHYFPSMLSTKTRRAVSTVPAVLMGVLQQCCAAL